MANFTYPKDASKFSAAKGRVFLITGTEPFFMEEALRSLKKRFLPEGLQLKQVWGEQICKTGGPELLTGGGDLFAEDYLFVLRGVDRLDRKYSKQAAERISETLEDSNSAYILLSEDSKKVSTYFKKLNGLHTAICYRPFTDQLKGWVSARAKKEDYSISSRAIAHMTKVLGNDLTAMDRELEKLFLFCIDDRCIEEEQVKKLVVANREGVEKSAGEIARAVLEGKSAEAFRLFRQIIATGGSAIMVVAFLKNQYQKMIQAHGILTRLNSTELLRGLEKYQILRHKDDYQSNMDKKNLRERVTRVLQNFDGYSFGQLHDMAIFRQLNWVTETLVQAMVWDESELLRIYTKLFELEVGLKSGQVDPEAGVETFIAEACKR